VPAAAAVLTGSSGNKPFGEMGNTACGALSHGLFLQCYCVRMVLAVKREALKSNLFSLLDGSGPFAKACSRQEEKAFLNLPMLPIIAN
jgi:hypothetical protein